jgi:hypothetical protein
VVVVLRDGTELVRWGVPLDDRPDLDVVDELAHVALAAKRAEVALLLDVRCPRLAEIIDLVGLGDALHAQGPADLADEGC